jgi:hypothetical protein
MIMLNIDVLVERVVEIEGVEIHRWVVLFLRLKQGQVVEMKVDTDHILA